MIKRSLYLIVFLFFHSTYTQNLLRALKCASASSAYYAQRYDQAYKCYEELLVDDPFDKRAVRGVADCLYSKNNFENAEKYYGQLSLRTDNSAQEAEEIYFNYGCAQAQQKKYKNALASFENVIKINQQHERAKKNVDILKKLLEQEKQEQKEQQKNKDQNKKQNKDQKKQQDQEKKQNEQNKSEDQEPDQKDSDKEKNGDLNKNGQQDKPEQDRQKQEQKQPDQQDSEKQQKNQSQQKEQREQPEKDEQKGGPEEQAAPNEQSPEKKQDQNQGGAKKIEQQLPEQMQAILQQAGELEKQGQQLYMRALAGQQKESGADHAW